jgi:predicted Zn-dependent protease
MRNSLHKVYRWAAALLRVGLVGLVGRVGFASFVGLLGFLGCFAWFAILSGCAAYHPRTHSSSVQRESPVSSPANSPASSPADTPANSPVNSSASSPTKPPANSPAGSQASSPANSPAGSPADAPATSPAGSPSHSSHAPSNDELGKKIYEELKSQLELTENPLIQTYVDRIGKRIVDHIPHNRVEFHYFVVKSDQLNAFALPNGYIFFTDRLLSAVRTEDELASVLCHETAHVTREHFRRLMEKQSKVDMATMAAMIAGVLLARDSELATAIQAFSIGTNQTFFLKYSREFEDEADEAGFGYLIGAGYQGQGAIDFMEKLRQLELITITPPIYLSNHPATSERVYHLEGLNQRHPSSPPSKPVGNIRRFQIWNRIETDNPQEYYQEILKKYQSDPDDPDLLYCMALVLGKVGREKESLDFFQKCLSINPNDNDAPRDMGISLFRQGKYPEAVKNFEHATRINPDDFLAFHYQGRTLREMNQLDKAIASLNKSKELQPDFPENYYFLGLLSQQKGQTRESHQNFSTYFSLKGNRKAAQFHRQEAERYKGSKSVQSQQK